jgi:S-formylglutathione hydrolase FrmB
MELDPAKSGTIELKLDQVAKGREFKETDTVKLFEIESQLLTKFHGKPTALRAGVVLPPSFGKEPERKYPVVYEVTGFGGNHFAAINSAARKAWDLNGTEALWVVLDANCRLGHHVFADSANNGPVGTALVTELIPALEKQFRGNGKRATCGHSSGGWSSLWLQVTYADTFAGCWSTAPDPVDFRDFQTIDIYAKGANAFKDASGKRPLARQNGKPALFFQPFSDMERYMARGGQLGSFEAVFSPRGTDGKPKQLWNRDTGAIDAEVAQAWERYDIRLVLSRNWKTLGPKLAGKVHVFMGDEDTFYLDGPCRLLKKELAALKSDAVVEMFPNRHHGNLVDAALRKRMNEEMAAALK